MAEGPRRNRSLPLQVASRRRGRCALSEPSETDTWVHPPHEPGPIPPQRGRDAEPVGDEGIAR